MAMAILARALSLRRANQRAKQTNPRLQLGADSIAGGRQSTNAALSPELESDYTIHSSRVSQSIDALYVLSCLRDGLSLADTFVSDDFDSATSTSCGARLSVEGNPARSSISLSSEHGVRTVSEYAWDRFSSSMSSSRSDSTDGSSLAMMGEKLAVSRQCTSRRSDAEDFCLVFSEVQRSAPESSPSPRAGIASDCCSFLMGRKSSHGEEEVRGIARKGSGNAGEADALSSSFLQVGGRSKQKSKSSGNGVEGAAVHQVLHEIEVVDDDVQRMLREGAIETVEKHSGNPYLDFRESMLEMMIATSSSTITRQYREVDDEHVFSRFAVSCADSKCTISMEDLLYCYLRLNSVELHELITQAFSDTCSDLLAKQPHLLKFLSTH